MSKLRLNVDPPYPGESLTSFIGRAAGFYQTSPPALLHELGQRLTGYAYRLDLDMHPDHALLDRLSRAVPNWVSPVEGHQGFRHWLLGAKGRTSYCVRCFEEDLAEGRTPYFRTDWIPVLVTSCWKHRVPLRNWTMLDSARYRILPASWLYRKPVREGESDVPAFFFEDQRKLDKLPSQGSVLQAALERMDALQRAVEKQVCDPTPNDDENDLFDQELQVYAEELIFSTMKFWGKFQLKGQRPVPRDPEISTWFDPYIDFPEKVNGMSKVHALRRASDLTWRRGYFWFVAGAFAPIHKQARLELSDKKAFEFALTQIMH